MTPRPRTRPKRSDSRRLYGLTGVAGIIVGLAIVFISYTANGGLPFTPSDRVFVELPNAQRLQRGSDVRIGGIRVGQVQSVAAIPPHGTRPAYARLQLSLSPSVGRLPVDSRVQEEPASILGASYLQLVLGTSRRRLAPGAIVGLAQSAPTVQLTDLLDIFNHATAQSIRSSLAEYSSGFAGRGADANAALASLDELIGPLRQVAQVVASPLADLGRFISGFDSTAGALAPVAGPFASLVAHFSTTLGAFDARRPQLAATIKRLPGTEATATAALQALNPSLDRLATLATQLLPGARLVPADIPLLTAALRAGVDPLRHIGPLTGDLRSTLQALGTLSAATPADGTLRILQQTTISLTGLLGTVVPAQMQCNILALWGRNLLLSTEQGNAEFPFIPLGIVGLGAEEEFAQHATPSPNLHTDYLPDENGSECESGNEPYNAHNQDLSNPPGTQPNPTPFTAPPPAATAEAAKAGLLAGTGGST
ncbi:MAG TPA: MlaD family protein [Solirubrobacteraceae bacterium]|nr:MlaD family protein [Solirubrobacteraceae bacterium]